MIKRYTSEDKCIDEGFWSSVSKYGIHTYSQNTGLHFRWIYINLALIRTLPYLREYSSIRLKHIPRDWRVCTARAPYIRSQLRCSFHALTSHRQFVCVRTVGCFLLMSLFVYFSFGGRRNASGRVNKDTRMAANSKMEQQPHPPAIIRRGGESCGFSAHRCRTRTADSSLCFIPLSIFHSTTLISILLLAQFKSPPARWHSGNVRPLLSLFFHSSPSSRFLSSCFLRFSTFNLCSSSLEFLLCSPSRRSTCLFPLPFCFSSGF